MEFCIRKDNRPYWLKKYATKLNRIYVRHFLKPQFKYLGKGGAYFKPRYIQVFGSNVTIDDYPTLIGASDANIQFTLPNGDTISKKSAFELKQLQHAFYFGGSLAADWKVPERAWYPEFKSQFANLFNYATIDFYWAVHSHKQGEWIYEPSSREKLDWAKSQGMRLRGHPLMWHEVIPEWISSAERPVEELDADIISHVKMLVDSYPEFG